jgi:hypothetical protein
MGFLKKVGIKYDDDVLLVAVVCGLTVCVVNVTACVRQPCTCNKAE